MSESLTPEDLKGNIEDEELTEDDVQALIDEYLELSGDNIPDQSEIKRILEKSRETDKLRVKGFKLTEDQYDSVLSYFNDKDNVDVEDNTDGNRLIELVLREFIETIE